MAFFSLIAIAILCIVCSLKDNFDAYSPRHYTIDEIQDMNNMCIGKTPEECRYVRRHYDRIKAGQDKKWN